MDEATRAYIAGFLDGDGSIILQLKPRADYVYGYQIKATVSFYQKRSNRHILDWLCAQMGLGAVRNRPDNISEYDIEGLEPVKYVLEVVRPYVVLKARLVEQVLELLEVITQTSDVSPKEFLRWAEVVESCQALNYSKRRKHRPEDVRRALESKGYLDPRND